MLPLMEEEFVQRKGWISDEDMLDVYSLCNTLPGVIAVNSSLMIGRMAGGFWGSVFSVFGVLLPSVVIILALASSIHHLADNPQVEWAFQGVRAGVSAMLLLVFITLGRKVLHDKRELFLAIFAFLILEVLGLSAVYTVVICAFMGWLLFRGEGEE